MSYQGWSDFRSDTVTRPTPEMYEAIRTAELGDDVLGDEPTVQKLERTAAEMTGKEAALFVPSGTMGNTIALFVHPTRAREVLLEEKCHILQFEAGNIGTLIGAVPHPLPSRRGLIDMKELQAGYKAPGNMHVAPTAGICLENTHNYHGGAVLPISYLREVHSFAREKGLFMHLDGARMFNAAVSLGVDVTEITACFDTVMFCLSKGLASPVGSMLVGSKEFIAMARFARKQFGGALRQSGILAACGLVSLQTMTRKLTDDHRRAQTFAQAIAKIPGLDISPVEVESNIVIFTVRKEGWSNDRLCGEMKKEKVLALTFGPGRVRMIVHKDIDDADINRAVESLRTILGHF